jgi:AMMECR1 domain-containing protein
LAVPVALRVLGAPPRSAPSLSANQDLCESAFADLKQERGVDWRLRGSIGDSFAIHADSALSDCSQRF